MAFSGLHVVCGYPGSSNNSVDAGFAIAGKAVWSETMASPGTTAKAAPASISRQGDPILQVDAQADCWVAVGPTPDASTGTRRLVRAGERYDFYVEKGDKLAWIAA